MDEQNIYLIAAIIGSIAGLTVIVGAIQNFVQPTLRRSDERFVSPRLFGLVSLRQQKKDKTWLYNWNKFRWVTAFVGILGAGLFIPFIIILLRHGFEINPSRFFALFIMFLLPAYLLIDTIVVECRLRKGKGSRVRKSAEIELVSDYNDLLFRCQRVLSEIGARITEFDAETGVLRARLRGSNLDIQISQLKGNHNMISIVSDSILPSVIFDFDANLKNVNEFVRRLLGLR